MKKIKLDTPDALYAIGMLGYAIGALKKQLDERELIEELMEMSLNVLISVQGELVKKIRPAVNKVVGRELTRAEFAIWLKKYLNVDGEMILVQETDSATGDTEQSGNE